MAAIAEQLHAVYAENDKPRGNWHPDQYPIVLPRGTFIDSLNTLRPAQSESDLPEQLSVPFLSDNMEAIYHASRRNGSTGQQIRLTESQITPITQEIEAGQNIYFNRRDGRNYSSGLIQGGPDHIPELVTDLNTLAYQDMYPVLSMHSHPSQFVPFPSLDDWIVLIQQRREGEDIPLVNATTILGSGIQVMAVMTDNSPLLEDRDIPAFRDKWIQKFERRGGREAAAIKQEIRHLHGDARIASQNAYTQFMNHAHDAFNIELAQDIGAKMYFSTNMSDFRTATPTEVVTQIRSMDTYKIDHAA